MVTRFAARIVLNALQASLIALIFFAFSGCEPGPPRSSGSPSQSDLATPGTDDQPQGNGTIEIATTTPKRKGWPEATFLKMPDQAPAKAGGGSVAARVDGETRRLPFGRVESSTAAAASRLIVLDLAVRTPDAGYHFEVDRLLLGEEGKLYLVGKLNDAGGMAAQVISTYHVLMLYYGPPRPVEKIVYGNIERVQAPEDVLLVPSADVTSALPEGKTIYP
jgi:hypothetical protein